MNFASNLHMISLIQDKLARIKIRVKKPYFPYKTRIRKKNTSSNPAQDKRINNLNIKTKCFKCGKIGHCANKCYTKKKINQIEDEGLINFLFKIMINNDTDDYEGDNISSKEDNSCHYTVNNCTKNNSDYVYKTLVIVHLIMK